MFDQNKNYPIQKLRSDELEKACNRFHAAGCSDTCAK